MNASQENFDYPSLSVLIADDNEINNILLKRMLAKFPFKLEFCTNGKEAVDKIAANPTFDVVLMDLNMPVMNGIEATQALRALEEVYYKNVPIIALTASVMKADLDDIMNCGMNDYLTKPYQVQELVSKILNLLAE